MFEAKPNKLTETDNSALKEITATAFGFLVKDYGFRQIKSDSNMVRYQSPKVFLNISLGRASLEIKVEIGLLPNQYGDAQPKFSLKELVELQGDRRKEEYSYFPGMTREQLQKNLPILAELIKKYAGDVLKGDYLVIQNLERLRFDSAAAFTKEARFNGDNFE